MGRNLWGRGEREVFLSERRKKETEEKEEKGQGGESV